MLFGFTLGKRGVAGMGFGVWVLVGWCGVVGYPGVLLFAGKGFWSTKGSTEQHHFPDDKITPNMSLAFDHYMCPKTHIYKIYTLVCATRQPPPPAKSTGSPFCVSQERKMWYNVRPASPPPHQSAPCRPLPRQPNAMLKWYAKKQRKLARCILPDAPLYPRTPRRM